MSTCKSLDECCDPIFSYAIQDSPTYYNTEQSFTAYCPAGFVCYPDSVTVTIRAGTISFRPGHNFHPPGTTPDGCPYTDAQEYVDCLAKQQAKLRAQAQLNYNNTEPGTTFLNAEQTAECPPGSTGEPVTVAAGVFSSLVSQADADLQALEFAEEQLCCNEGAPTSCDLSIADNTVLGQVTIPQVATANNIAFGSFGDWASYKLRWVDGYYSWLASSPPPDHQVYTGNGLKARYWVGEFFSEQNLPTRTDDLNPAVVEAAFAGAESVEFQSGGGEIQLRWDGWGGYSALTNTNGSPNPTWELVRTRRLIDLPVSIHILNWETIKAQLTPCAQCQDDEESRPEWDGSFNFRDITGFNGVNFITIPKADWISSGEEGTLALNGKWEGLSTVRYSDSALPTATGCGWVLEIFCIDQTGPDRILIWTGVKGYGDTPQGKYCRSSNIGSGIPCITGPAMIEIGEGCPIPPGSACPEQGPPFSPLLEVPVVTGDQGNFIFSDETFAVPDDCFNGHGSYKIRLDGTRPPFHSNLQFDIVGKSFGGSVQFSLGAVVGVPGSPVVKVYKNAVLVANLVGGGTSSFTVDPVACELIHIEVDVDFSGYGGPVAQGDLTINITPSYYYGS